MGQSLARTPVINTQNWAIHNARSKRCEREGLGFYQRQGQKSNKINLGRAHLRLFSDLSSLSWLNLICESTLFAINNSTFAVIFSFHSFQARFLFYIPKKKKQMTKQDVLAQYVYFYGVRGSFSSSQDASNESWPRENSWLSLVALLSVKHRPVMMPDICECWRCVL